MLLGKLIADSQRPLHPHRVVQGIPTEVLPGHGGSSVDENAQCLDVRFRLEVLWECSSILTALPQS